MRTTCWLLLTAAFVLAGSEAMAQEITIPDGVRYEYASQEVNEKATEKIKLAFSADEDERQLESLFAKRLICGPYLWKLLKDDPQISELKNGKTVFQIPMTENGKVVRTDNLEGKLFQSADECRKFAEAFQGIYDFETEVTVRKLTPPELSLYWSMIPFDIKEPVFVVDSGKHKILLAFEAENSTVMMVDDYQLLYADSEAGAEPAPAAETKQIRLYVPNNEIVNRVGEDVTPLADYLKALEKKADTIFEELPERPSAGGVLVAVGIKSKSQAKVWCQAVDGDLPPELVAKLEKELGAIPAIDLEKSPFGFAIEIRLYGKNPTEFPAFPDLWLDTAKEHAKGNQFQMVPPENLFKIIWPDE